MASESELDCLRRELVAAWTVGLSGSELSEAHQLLESLVADWAEEAGAGPRATAVLAELSQELTQAGRGQNPVDRLDLLRVQVLGRRVRQLRSESYALGTTLIECRVSVEEARARGEALLAKADPLGPALQTLRDSEMAKRLKGELGDVWLEAQFAIHGKLMSLRLGRYQQERLPTDLLHRYEEARTRGARHEAQLYRAKQGILTGDFNGGPWAGRSPLVAIARIPETDRDPPAAFLASFNSFSGTDSLFPLRWGVNRVGYATGWGDFSRTAGAVTYVEGRQWQIEIQPGRAVITDPGSSNSSRVIPRGQAKLDAVSDPRFDASTYYYSELSAVDRQGLAALGTAEYELAEGDVLLCCYCALVFGWWP